MALDPAKFRQIQSLPDPGTTNLTGQEWHDAALAICARARSKADAVLILPACGLIPDNGQVT